MHCISIIPDTRVMLYVVPIYYTLFIIFTVIDILNHYYYYILYTLFSLLISRTFVIVIDRVYYTIINSIL